MIKTKHCSGTVIYSVAEKKPLDFAEVVRVTDREVQRHNTVQRVYVEKLVFFEAFHQSQILAKESFFLHCPENDNLFAQV